MARPPFLEPPDITMICRVGGEVKVTEEQFPSGHFWYTNLWYTAPPSPPAPRATPPSDAVVPLLHPGPGFPPGSTAAVSSRAAGTLGQCPIRCPGPCHGWPAAAWAPDQRGPRHAPALGAPPAVGKAAGRHRPADGLVQRDGAVHGRRRGAARAAAGVGCAAFGGPAAAGRRGARHRPQSRPVQRVQGRGYAGVVRGGRFMGSSLRGPRRLSGAPPPPPPPSRNRVWIWIGFGFGG